MFRKLFKADKPINYTTDRKMKALDRIRILKLRKHIVEFRKLSPTLYFNPNPFCQALTDHLVEASILEAKDAEPFAIAQMLKYLSLIHPGRRAI